MDQRTHKEQFNDDKLVLELSKYRLISAGTNKQDGQRIFHLWLTHPTVLPSLVCRMTEHELNQFGLCVHDHGAHLPNSSRYTLVEKNWFKV